MKNVPDMIYDLIEKEKEEFTCNGCNNVHFTKKHLSLVGIMPSVHIGDHRDVLTLGFFCKKCQELTLFEVQDMTLMELSSCVFNTDIKSTREDKRGKKSKPKTRKKLC
jgi:hypothetical protein